MSVGKVKLKFIILISFGFFFKCNYSFSQSLVIDSVTLNLIGFKNIIPDHFPFAILNFAVNSEEDIAIWYKDYIYLYHNRNNIDSIYFKFNSYALLYYNVNDSLVCTSNDSICFIDFRTKNIRKYLNESIAAYFNSIDDYSDFFSCPGRTGYYKNKDCLPNGFPDVKYDFIYKLFKDTEYIYSATDNVIYRYPYKEDFIYELLPTERALSGDVKLLSNFDIYHSRIIYVSKKFDFIFYETMAQLCFENLNSHEIRKLYNSTSYNISFKKVRNKNKIWIFNYKSTNPGASFFILNW